MDSHFPAIISLSLIFALFGSSFAHSSTIGVEYISRILEIQDRERAPPAVQVAAARAVLRRLLPSHSSSFHFEIVSKVFHITAISIFFFFFFVLCLAAEKILVSDFHYLILGPEQSETINFIASFSCLEKLKWKYVHNQLETDRW